MSEPSQPASPDLLLQTLIPVSGLSFHCSQFFRHVRQVRGQLPLGVVKVGGQVVQAGLQVRHLPFVLSVQARDLVDVQQ